MADEEEDKKENEEAEELENTDGEESEDGDDSEDGEEGEDGKKKKKKKKLTKKKKIILIGGVVGLLVVIGVVVMLMGGGDDGTLAEGDPHADAKAGAHGDEVFVGSIYLQMPDITVNLNSSSRRPHFINLKITLELAKTEDIEVIEAQMPKIVDSFNTYLREIKREDLQGSAGLYRLEHELMLRLEKTLVKGEVTDILFREVIVQ